MFRKYASEQCGSSRSKRVLAAKLLGIARRADGDPIIRQVGVTSLVSCDCGGVVHGCSGLTDR
jgi:hypothetical protein